VGEIREKQKQLYDHPESGGRLPRFEETGIRVTWYLLDEGWL
jgi:hypothetical protein